MTIVAGALFFFTASTFFMARLSSHIDQMARQDDQPVLGLSLHIDGPIFFMMSGCTGQETAPGRGHVADDEVYLGGANTKKGGVPFYIAAAHMFIYRPVGTCGLCPVIVH